MGLFLTQPAWLDLFDIDMRFTFTLQQVYPFEGVSLTNDGLVLSVLSL